MTQPAEDESMPIPAPAFPPGPYPVTEEGTPIHDRLAEEMAVADDQDGLVAETDNGPEEGAEEAPQDEQLEITDADLDEGETDEPE
jgi:hypothetical protein